MAARNVAIEAKGASFDAVAAGRAEEPVRLRTGQPSPYVAYNLLAAWTVARLMGIGASALQQAADEFDPRNGRLQAFEVRGRPVLLNLAKNPTGFNQNLKIIERDEGPKAIALFLNDREADGRDVSWIWDIDFEELASQKGCLVFAGGTRAHDMQVRLKYAGVEAALIGGIEEAFAALDAPGCPLEAQAAVYAIANYTALPPVHEALGRLAARGDGAGSHAGTCAGSEPGARPQSSEAPAEGASPIEASCASALPKAQEARSATEGPHEPVAIAHLLPDLLNLYGDGGNVRVLEQRLRWRGIPVEVREVRHGEAIDLGDIDLAFLGGGPDREQRLAGEELMALRDDLARFVDEGGALLAICGGYQILGRRWLLGDEQLPGLDIIPMETRRPGASANRLVNDVALRSPLARRPAIGYENHAGRTCLDQDVTPFGTIASRSGSGNNEHGNADGVLFRNVVGTYLHGPLLAKNPEVADWLLQRALERHETRTGCPAPKLDPLDDSAEVAANDAMALRLGVAWAHGEP